MPKPIDHVDLSIVTPQPDANSYYLEYRLEAENEVLPPENRVEVVQFDSSTYVAERQNIAGPENELDVRTRLSVKQAAQISLGIRSPLPPALPSPTPPGNTIVWTWPEADMDVELVMEATSYGNAALIAVVQDPLDPERWNIAIKDAVGRSRANGFISVKFIGGRKSGFALVAQS